MYVFAYFCVLCSWHIISAVHCVIADRVRMEDVISVILYTLYCYVFSPEVIWQHRRRLSSRRWCLCSVCVQSCVLEEACLRRVICMEGRSYAFKASLPLLASRKSPTLPLKTHVRAREPPPNIVPTSQTRLFEQRIGNWTIMLKC